MRSPGAYPAESRSASLNLYSRSTPRSSHRALDPATSPLDQPNDTRVAQMFRSLPETHLASSPFSRMSHFCSSNIQDADLSPTSLEFLPVRARLHRFPGSGCWILRGWQARTHIKVGEAGVPGMYCEILRAFCQQLLRAVPLNPVRLCLRRWAGTRVHYKLLYVVGVVCVGQRDQIATRIAQPCPCPQPCFRVPGDVNRGSDA